MMQKVFEDFKILFEKRYNEISVLEMGEDSVRYDFFEALKKVYNLNQWELQLEYPIHNLAFERTEVAGRKRNEKPQIDLHVNTPKVKLCVEFGMFRRNSNENGTIARTENTFKMFNDFIRLALHSHFHKCEAYFVCVADKCMLNHQLELSEIPAFPGVSYKIDIDLLSEINSYKSAKVLDKKFLNKKKEIGMIISANLIHQCNIESLKNSFETKLLLWQVKSELLVSSETLPMQEKQIHFKINEN